MSIFSAIGGLIGGFMQNKAAKEQQRFQQEYAMKNIRWKVKDAKAAGVHPLAALGVQPAGGAPTAIPDYSDMGQNVGRAIDATMTGEQKMSDYSKAAQSLSLERMELENSVIRNQLVNSVLRTVNQPANAPTFVSGASSGVGPGENIEARNNFRELHGSDYITPPGPTAQQIEDDTGDMDIPELLARIYRKYDMNFERYFPYHAKWDKYWQSRQRSAPGRSAARALMHERRANRGTDYGYW